MPVAEPYPISEQFSTSGKINLNYAMMPFPYIQRKTGMDAIPQIDSGSTPFPIRVAGGQCMPGGLQRLVDGGLLQ